MDAVTVCVAACLHVSMCCMRTHAWTDDLPRNVCYAEMLYAEKMLRVIGDRHGCLTWENGNGSSSNANRPDDNSVPR